MSDMIDLLPHDDIPPDAEEKLFLGKILFPSEDHSDDHAGKRTLEYLFTDIKGLILVSAFFALLQSNAVTEAVRNTIPYANKSNVSLIVCKTAIFAVGVFTYNNLKYIIK